MNKIVFIISFASLANTRLHVRAHKKTKLHKMHMDALGRLEIRKLHLTNPVGSIESIYQSMWMLRWPMRAPQPDCPTCCLSL